MKAKPELFRRLRNLGASAAIAVAGAFLVIPHEGQVNRTYVDPVGILTSCIGHTGKELRIGQRFTDDQCYSQLSEDLAEADMYVSAYIRTPLNLYQRAALISFTYNVGGNNLRTSTMAKKFNARDYEGGCHELLRWVYAGGRKFKGLVIRREDEEAMCLGKVDISEVMKQ